MPQLGTKHENARTLSFKNFSGGLNLALAPEALADNELQAAENFEFDPKRGGLRLRGGVETVRVFANPITDLLPAPEAGTLLVKSGGNLHKIVLAGDSNTVVSEYADLGAVDGDKTGVSELWDQGMLLAFGGHLYLYLNGFLSRVDSSQAPDKVDALFVRAGRVAVAQAGSDTIRFSGIGDPSRWTEGNDSDSVSVDIGYKDGCSIQAVVSIVGEMIIFKSPDGQPEKGRIYRLQGNYPNWSIVPYSTGASAWNPRAAIAVGNDVVFLTREGMGNLSTVTEFGDFKLRWAGTKVNPVLSPLLSKHCRFWHIAGRSQVWVGTDAEHGDVIWCWHYDVGGGAWTTLKFPGHVTAVARTRGHTYLAMENKVLFMNDKLSDDSGVPIVGRIRPKTIAGTRQLLLKGIVARYYASELSKVSVWVEGLEVRMPSDFADNIAYLDDDIACQDNDPLVPIRMGKVIRQRCNIRKWDITPEFIVTNGAFHVMSLELDIVEV